MKERGDDITLDFMSDNAEMAKSRIPIRKHKTRKAHDQIVFYVTCGNVSNETSYEFISLQVSSWMNEIWMKLMPIVETKFGMFCISTFL